MSAWKRMAVVAMGSLLMSGAALAEEEKQGKYQEAEEALQEGTGGSGMEKAEKKQAMKQEQNIIEKARAAGNFKTFLKAVDAAGLTETLKEEGPFTVFAPTDEAFAKIPQAQLDALLKDKERLQQVLLSHVVPGRVSEAEVRALEPGTEVRTAADTELSVKQEGKKLVIEGATVVQPGLQASNGIIHSIDKVILEPMK
jgi:uncharacterized surface protein with fasciclin (FAS1) repeats